MVLHPISLVEIAVDELLVCTFFMVGDQFVAGQFTKLAGSFDIAV